MAKGFKSGGRQKGTPNKVTVASRQRIEGEADPLGFLSRVMRGEGIEAVKPTDENQPDAEPSLIYPSLGQRMYAAGRLADKLVPNPKSRAVSLNLPPISKASDVLAALSEVMAAMGRGEITIDECQQIAAALDLHRRAVETVEIEARVAALEAARGKG